MLIKPLGSGGFNMHSNPFGSQLYFGVAHDGPSTSDMGSLAHVASHHHNTAGLATQMATAYHPTAEEELTIKSIEAEVISRLPDIEGVKLVWVNPREVRHNPHDARPQYVKDRLLAYTLVNNNPQALPPTIPTEHWIKTASGWQPREPWSIDPQNLDYNQLFFDMAAQLAWMTGYQD